MSGPRGRGQNDAYISDFASHSRRSPKLLVNTRDLAVEYPVRPSSALQPTAQSIPPHRTTPTSERTPARVGWLTRLDLRTHIVQVSSESSTVPSGLTRDESRATENRSVVHKVRTRHTPGGRRRQGLSARSRIIPDAHDRSDSDQKPDETRASRMVRQGVAGCAEPGRSRQCALVGPNDPEWSRFRLGHPCTRQVGGVVKNRKRRGISPSSHGDHRDHLTLMRVFA